MTLPTRWTFALALATGLLAAPPAFAGWEPAGTGGCEGGDFASSKGALPTADRCDVSANGFVAVCWDGVQHRHTRHGNAACTYKRLTPEACKGGPNVGLMYRCNAGGGATHGATPAPPPPPSPTAPPQPGLVAPPPGNPPPAAAGFAWRSIGPGDCNGNDAASSLGAQPAPNRCERSTVGTAAVCWDGATYRNPRSPKAACTYKKTLARACSGGKAPGLMYECVDLAAAAPVPTGPAVQPGPAVPPPTGPAPQPPYAPPPSAAGFSWRYAAVSDCPGNDVGSSQGAQPDLGRCDASTVGTSAVCWDGVQQKHRSFGHAACTYKRTPAANCKGGAIPGFMYECVGSAAAPQPTPPPASTGFSWRPVGTSDCTGNDAASSNGSQPVPAYCDAAAVGKAAICWAANCTYKRVNARDCRGGARPGTMYECVSDAPALQPYQPPPPQPPQPPPASGAYTWRYLGTSDCSGYDLATSPGPTPVVGYCNASAAGKAAVCWGTSCTYKSVFASACRGGANPGALYECVGGSSPGLAAPPPQPPPGPPPPPAAGGFAWKYVSVANCPGKDVTSTPGAMPTPAMCNAGNLGKAAVCWDGVSQKNNGLPVPSCTYKKSNVNACNKPANPGFVWECTAATGAAPPPPPQPPPHGQQGAAPLTWTYVGVGDCGGYDVGSSQGPQPTADRCDASNAGMAAVCWDGLQQRHNNFGHAACTYKKVPASNCKGGANPGFLYRCGP